MSWRNLLVGKKLAVGFGSLLVLIVVASWTGLSGITNVSDAMYAIGDEESPLVEAANEMKISLLVARNAMEEYKSATSVMATDDEKLLNNIVSAYEQSLVDFDLLNGAIVEGGTLADGTVVIALGTNQGELLVWMP